MNLYKREEYLKRIRGFYHDTEIIKVISGVRRCGKSSLMLTIKQELLDSGCITEEEAKNHPRKNIITRALGTNNRVNVDIIKMDKC